MGMFSKLFLSFRISDKNFACIMLVLRGLIDLLAFIVYLIAVAETLSYCFKIVCLSRFSVASYIKQEPQRTDAVP